MRGRIADFSIKCRIMRFRYSAVLMFTLVVAAGCSSTKVLERDTYEGPKIPQADRIIVHNFVADPAEVPPGSWFSRYTANSKPLTSEQLEVSRKLGAEMADQLVEKLNAFGLPAVRAAGQPAPLINDIVIRGYFVSVSEGSATKRVALGMGYGNAELTTAVEVFQMTPEGLRRLGGGKVKSGGAYLPGAAVPVGIFAATANPIALIVGGTVRGTAEATGSGSMDQAITRSVDEIAQKLKEGAERQGWDLGG